ncbi:MULTISPECIES: glycerol-3-phosphate responsive antiterminator [Oceanobacillus]|uniref:Glycerol uptake operon antiterminator regulatory protein n=1 Tax=Oceanobacillus kimchii TaxID=746691 RepID=A0ABQ5TQE5_9BACI|nr:MULTISPECIES: glycerol-3-phosphate responsive antiterminator [Oceanobacillus]MBT2600326.1 glycerol-3-phosphate responsive antiterminator [Oceanobacillus sp. ISL-74]MBT2650484.1 glycerol-3-phosphate responsive antiterminator [Oceanobacillus sp. ISL-73]MCT1578227.1 glycerol-3-phosphate responsive antiterminator [Oceanobacillus kimchii]MCT2134405.1 glycerol-3-phosphate responsive antiterminator [Oceanobacillus kimchii]OEH54966.1 antiterminator [Oceanobacillus sp. E9]
MAHIVDIVQSQVIASVKKEQDIQYAITSNANVIFLLTGNLLSTKQYIDRLKEANKSAFIHLDFIDGLTNSRNAIQYIAREWKPLGIVTTKSNLIKYAKEENLATIQRIFVIDKNALSKGVEIANSVRPDAIEILPGLMPKIIDQITKQTHLPVIAGGLISEKQEIMNGLEAGALAISSGDPSLWNLDL